MELLVKNTNPVSKQKIDEILDFEHQEEEPSASLNCFSIEPDFYSLDDSAQEIQRGFRQELGDPENIKEIKRKGFGDAFGDKNLIKSSIPYQTQRKSYYATTHQPIQQPNLEFEKDIEKIVEEKWRYLVMQFGGVFMTEIRPNKCAIGNKTLADLIINYNKKTKDYGLNLEILNNYLKEKSSGNIQVHFSDIMFNPKLNDFDLFSITSGDTKKAGIFVDLAKFLSDYNKSGAIIPVHVPYYEKFKTSEKVVEFGNLSENGKRDAVMRAEKVLRYLSNKIENTKDVKIALETGSGESEKTGHINYALIYEPHYLKFLVQGRKNVSLCEDIGHLNLTDTDWKDYLQEEISEFHVSGNNGKEDQHTLATEKTLKNYEEVMSFLKFYSGNICAEIGKGELSRQEFLDGVKNLAYTLFSEPSPRDFENLKKVETYLKITDSRISEKNLNQERYQKYLEWKK